MTRKQTGRRKRTRPVELRQDPRPVTPVDSEDETGTYAPARSIGDTGESDDGVFAQGPLPGRTLNIARIRRRKEVLR